MKMKDDFRHTVGGPIKGHPAVFAVYVVLRALVIVSLVRAALREDWESVFVCGLVLVLFLLPNFFERRLHIQLPSLLEILILLFIFAAEMLGELQSYYVRFAHWDTMLHTINGFVCAAVGFSLVDILNRNKQEKFRLSPLFLTLVAFCFSMTVGVMWEFFEYGMDTFFHTDMQKDTVIHALHTVALDATASNQVVAMDVASAAVNGQELGLGGYLDIGLHDTMEDLLVNFAGALLFSPIGYVYTQKRGKGALGRLAGQFIPTLQKDTAGDSVPNPPQEDSGPIAK